MYAVTDIETTGRDPWRNEILEIATIVANDEFTIVDKFVSRIRPNNVDYWEEEAQEVHRIKLSTTIDFPSQKEVLSDYVKFMSRFKKSKLVCHALPFKSPIDLFDRNFIFSWFWNNDRRYDYYDIFKDEETMTTISRKVNDTKNKYGIINQKLDTWMDRLGIDKSEHHTAAFDALVCLKILKFKSNFVSKDIFDA